MRHHKIITLEKLWRILTAGKRADLERLARFLKIENPETMTNRGLVEEIEELANPHNRLRGLY